MRRKPFASRAAWRRCPASPLPMELPGREKVLAAQRGAALEALAREISLLRDAREVDRERIETLTIENAALRSEIAALRGGRPGATA